MMRLALGAVTALLVACGPPQIAGPCTGDQDCALEGGGRCLPSPAGANACAYPDLACSGGYHWGELAGSIAGECLDQSERDAGIDADRDGGPAQRWGLLVANARAVDNNPVEPLRLYAPDGQGTYASVWTSDELDWGRSVAWADFDQDGDQDFAVGNGFLDRARNRVYRNDGGGAFSVFWTATDVAYTNTVKWADVDRDGDLDLLAVFNSGVYVYRQDGGTLISGSYAVPSSASVSKFDVGDFNGDGAIDLAAVGQATASSSVWLNGGTGTFSRLPWDSGPSISVALGDYDSDGDLDLALGRTSSFSIYKNEGGIPVATFSSTEIGISDSTNAMAWLDFDRDGDLDLVCAHTAGNSPAPVRVYRNAGGTFSVVWTSVETSAFTSVSVADFNSDGRPDLAVGARGAPNRIYRNDGGGVFSSSWNSTESETTNAVAWAPL